MDIMKFREAIGKHGEWLEAQMKKIDNDIIVTAMKVAVLEKLPQSKSFKVQLDGAKKRVEVLLDTKKHVDEYEEAFRAYAENDKWITFMNEDP